MAKIGSLGSLVFQFPENTVRTFDELSWKVSAKYATHDRHIKRDVLEFLDRNPEQSVSKWRSVYFMEQTH
ncbi:MAG: hypothetical protein ACLRYD_17140 [Ruminococcus callidus]